MAGRLSGIFVSKVLKPRTMIAASLVGCLAASIILVIWGASSAIGVYIGTCKLETVQDFLIKLDIKPLMHLL